MRCWYSCVRGCEGQYEIDQTIYHCPQCGGLLDVEHDLAPLKSRSAAEWKQLFRERAMEMVGPEASGVWSKGEWVLPTLDPAYRISLGEGRTPLLSVPRLAEDLGVGELWMKQCGTTQTGSFKDLGMTVLISQVNQMIANGSSIQAVICASTGDTSAALAAYGARAGIPTIVLLPEGKISNAQLAQPLANGAIVLALQTDFDGCMRVVEEVSLDPQFYLANSKNSLRIEGQKTLAIEIVEQLAWEPPDWIVIPCGNLGNVSALGKGLVLMKELGLIQRIPRILAAQAAQANPLYRSYQNGFESLEPQVAGQTLATAIRIGDPVSYERAVKVLRELNGAVGEASEAALVDAATKADLRGLYTCPQTGVALACLSDAAKAGLVKRADRVVVISTAHGLKFTEFKTQDQS
ncbi:threonine synthase, partial [Candidatus Bipolaricaulota bacterium]|nr:threonine synthase [Candidatus Bipolaricaulota bacterium]